MLRKILCFTILVCSLFVASTAVYSKTGQSKNQPNAIALFKPNIQEISINIVQFLKTTSLHPYITGPNWKFSLVGIDPMIEKKDNIVSGIIYGETTRENEKYKLAFLVSKNTKTNEIIKTQFLYIGNTLISARLLVDIYPVAIGASQLKDNDTHYLFIKSMEPKNEKQEWVFFNKKPLKKLEINLKPDGKGGNYFNIKEIKS